jgi:hypothetical protein
VNGYSSTAACENCPSSINVLVSDEDIGYHDPEFNIDVSRARSAWASAVVSSGLVS